jgi:hypothetical protein
MGAMALVGSTVYDIRIDYKLDDRASKGLKDISKEAQNTGKHLTGLKTLVAGVAGGFLVGAGAKALIGFNANLDQMRIQLGGIISMNMAMPFDKASDAAAELFDRFQEAAKKSPAMTKDYIEMANGIASAASQAGLSLNQLHDLTVGGVTASTVFGTRGDVAALDISQMLQGVVGLKDRMARSLLASQGITDHKEFNKMDSAKRAGIVMKSLNDPRLKKAADEFGDSFSGQFSTLQDQIQITLGKVGLPLFKQITAELKSWNDWIERNPEAINKMVKDLGSGLVDGFHFLKEVVQMIVSHKDTLLMIGKIWAVNKGMGVAGDLFAAGGKGGASLLNMFTGPAGKLGATFTALNAPAESLGAGLKGAASGFVGIIGAVGQLAGALGLVYIAAQAFASWVDEKQTDDINKRAALAGQRNFAHRFMAADGKVQSAADAYRLADNGLKWNQRDTMIDAQEKRKKEMFSVLMSAQETGLIGFDNGNPVSNIDGSAGWERAKANLISMGSDAKEAGETLMATAKAFELATHGDTMYSREDWIRLDPVARAQAADEERKKREADEMAKLGKGMNLNVKIDRIEVTSDDPDRFVYGVVNAFEDAVQNPTQAAGTIRGIGG